MLLSFNPGPSALHPSVQKELLALAKSDKLSRSHRSPEFQNFILDLRRLIHEKLKLPPGYEPLFAPSATAAMEMILRNLRPEKSLHLIHGAFARRFAETSKALNLDPKMISSKEARTFAWTSIHLPAACELITLTHNETSTGSAWPLEELRALRNRWASPLLVVDATSSLGGPQLPLGLADLWFASVQKCLGLPSGLALILVSPRALAQMKKKTQFLASWANLPQQAQGLAEGRPIETPNMLALYLLKARLERYDQGKIDQETAQKNKSLQAFVPQIGSYFIQDPAWRSCTVHNILVPDPKSLQNLAEDHGFLLGGGYGDLASKAIRIANFPAHSKKNLDALLFSLAQGAKPS
jgi:phosphoserine aminotransferase